MKAVSRALEEIKREGLFRRLRLVASSQEAELLLDGKRVINFSGNNTLGLATHPAIAKAAAKCLARYGMGSGASRLISGNMEPHERIEEALSDFLEKDKTLFFPSGFQANVGSIPALTNPGDIILTDELNHASLIDGIRLSYADKVIYPHNDVEALDRALLKIPANKRVMVVTESLFSMQGDRVPLEAIAELKKKRPFFLYLDEAHAIGTIGPDGRGIAAEAGCIDDVDVQLGTLGKAFGISGAFIASNKKVIELLINRARSFIYTTAPPPLIAASALAALLLVKEGDLLRARLRKNSDGFRSRIQDILGPSSGGQDHIIPVMVSDPDRVMRVCKALFDRGIYCQGIRPPTVPPGQCRLRFSISASHTSDHLDQAADALHEVFHAEP